MGHEQEHRIFGVIIDAHMHVDDIPALGWKMEAGLVRRLDEAGIDRGVVMTIVDAPESARTRSTSSRGRVRPIRTGSGPSRASTPGTATCRQPARAGVRLGFKG